MAQGVHNNNNGATAGGFAAILIGALKGWVDIGNLEEGIVLSAIGAVVGFIINLILKWLEKKIRAKWFKNS